MNPGPTPLKTAMRGEQPPPPPPPAVSQTRDSFDSSSAFPPLLPLFSLFLSHFQQIRIKIVSHNMAAVRVCAYRETSFFLQGKANLRTALWRSFCS
ncbi:hypothetical protein PO909_011079 [Leuciscus waleckii]